METIRQNQLDTPVDDFLEKTAYSNSKKSGVTHHKPTPMNAWRESSHLLQSGLNYYDFEKKILILLIVVQLIVVPVGSVAGAAKQTFEWQNGRLPLF